MHKKMIKFTCPKMALRWSIHIIISLLLLFVLIYFPKEIYLKVFFAIAIVCLFFVPVKLSGYGFSVFRCFILVKIDSKGISNIFCKIKWNEIVDIQYEMLETEFKAKYNKMRIAGNFGLVMFLTGKANENATFRKYSLKKTICVPFDEKIIACIPKCKEQAITIED